MIVVDGRRGGAISGTSAVLGRRTELALIEQLIADPAPRPRGIALEGEAGIGKTILWQTGVEHASALGIPVLRTRGSEPDTDVSFAALGELLAPVVDDAWDALPEPHDAVLPALYGHLALTECWAGRCPAGQRAVEIAMRNANTGMAPVVLHVAQALLYILTGEVDVGRSLIATRMPSDGSSIDAQRTVVYEHVLGFAALVQGRDDEAARRLWSAYQRARAAGIHDPGRRQRLEGDLGQALINTGRLDDARTLAAELHAFAERTERPMLLGIAARIEGLAQAAAGDLDAAGFTELGAVPFVQAAQAELDRTQRTRTRGALTPSERQVADLVAGGLTNREVAARLFTSVRTVEGHRAAAYRKLGVRSRTELAKRAAVGPVGA